MRMSIALFTLIAFLSTLLPAHPSWADETPAGAEDETLAQAKSHFEAGRSAYDAQDFATALKEFKAAQAIRPSPILDYNMGLALEGLGKRNGAVRHYRLYLDQRPDAPNRADVEKRITALEAPPPTVHPTLAPPLPAAPPPPAVAAPTTPQYQYYDPYGYYYKNYPYKTYPYVAPAMVKRKSRWWIVFPVVGGIATIIFVAVLAAGVKTGSVHGSSLTVHPQPADDPGVLLRF